MERDPNRLSGLTEAELARKERDRNVRSTRVYFAKKLFHFWWIVVFTLVALGLVGVAMLFNMPDLVVRFGSLVVLGGAATNYWISSSARSELDEAIAANHDFNFRTVAAHEARLVLKQANPDAFVTTMAPPPDFRPMLEQLERQKRPFVWLEIGLVLGGTAIAVFGDWATCLIHQGVCTQC